MWTARILGLSLLAGTVFLPLLAAVDLDQDGLSDVWEMWHNATSEPANADPDGDGHDNQRESVAGTNPFAPHSFATVSGIERHVDGTLVARWQGQAGKDYRLEASVSGQWIPLSPVRLGTDAELTQALPGWFAAPNSGRLRLAISERDSDGDGLNDWEESVFGTDPLLPQTIANIDDYDHVVGAMTAPNFISVQAIPSNITENGTASFLVTRSGGVQPLTIQIGAGGTLLAGVDTTPLPNSVQLPMFATSVTISVQPTGEGFPSEIERLTVSVLPSADYQPASEPATVTVHYERPAVFAAALRHPTDSHLPTHGNAILFVEPDRSAAVLRVEFDGATPGLTAPLLLHGAALLTSPPIDQSFPIDAFLVERLTTSNLTINIGGFVGTFFLADGAQPFEPPATAALWSEPTPSADTASRLLAQATFGPTRSDIAAVQALGMEGWIDQQLALPPSLHLPFLLEREANGLPNNQGERIQIWWDRAVNAPDQLRQRVAFALSEILVVSDRDSQTVNYPLGCTSYQDLLVNGSFGSYRDLLKGVTKHPVMGMYLSHLRNRAPNDGVFPDENYAREVMQLFSIGLWKLYPDGGRIIGPDGGHIPTYEQPVVEDMARVLTGWAFQSNNPQNGFFSAPADAVNPMMLYPRYHDDGVKVLLDGLILPADQGGEADLDATMDMLANHPNTAPFISFRLIQRLVTSNPSPAYVHRVAEVFRTTNGNLGEVVKALLLDPEARDPALIARSDRGHLREPLLRTTGLFRAFDGKPPSGAFRIVLPFQRLTQGPLQSPSVFNFFEPDFSRPGDIADAKLRSPAFQILSANNAIKLVNTFFETVEVGMISGAETVTLDLAYEASLAADPAALVDHIDTLLLYGSMSASLRAELLSHLAAVPASNPGERARSAVHLVVSSPEYAIQK